MVDVTGNRIGWMDSANMPSRIHRTINGGKSTICGHVPSDNPAWNVAVVPSKDHGRSRYCRTCFCHGGKSLPWVNND